MKINIDREPISSDYIESKKDFNRVLESVKAAKLPIWKSKWFYGTVGMASIGGVVLLTSFNDGEVEGESSKLNALASHLTIEKATETDLKEEGIPSETTEFAGESTESKAIVDVAENPESVLNESVDVSKEENLVEYTESEEFEEEEEFSNALNYPSINGVFTGDVTHKDLQSGIFINEGLRVLEFNLRYPLGSDYKELKVYGNKIPNEILEEISEVNRGMVFFTDIFVQNRDGASFHTPSMNLFLVKE